MQKAARLLLSLTFLGTLGSLGAMACGQSDGASGDRDAGLDASGAEDAGTYPYVVPDAPCEIVIDKPPLSGQTHVPVGTPVDYNSNPPSSGLHYEDWAVYKEFTTPVDRRNYVHNLEHGAIVFAYRCAEDASGCAQATELLRSVADSLDPDPLCRPPVRVRTVITPDPLLDVPIAAAAWGYTYRAQCLHKASLEDFARAHYGKGPEDVCRDGQVSF